MKTVNTLLAVGPVLAALRSGLSDSRTLALAPAAIKPVHDGFAGFVRELRFDFGELAIMTFFQARAADVPLSLLPVTLSGGCHHSSLVYNPAFGTVKPEELAGARIGVRSYSQTTPTWVRGVLAQDYGLDLEKLTWVSNEEPHVLSYRPPSNVERVERHRTPIDLLLRGEVAAAILGSDVRGDLRFRSVIEDAEARSVDWVAAHGFAPINHMAVVRTSLLQHAPEVVRELYEALLLALRSNPASSSLPIGIDAVRRPLEYAANLAVAQRLIPRRPSVDELFADAAAVLDLGSVA